MTTPVEQTLAFHVLRETEPDNHLLDCPDAVVIRGDNVPDQPTVDGNWVTRVWAIQCGHPPCSGDQIRGGLTWMRRVVCGRRSTTDRTTARPACALNQPGTRRRPASGSCGTDADRARCARRAGRTVSSRHCPREPALDDLLRWLREQVAETRRIALACGDEDARTWLFTDPDGETVRAADGDYVAIGPWGGDVNADYARHIVRNDPRATLARCDAHEAILDFIERNAPKKVHAATLTPDILETAVWSGAVQDLLTKLALAYQHRPGYEAAVAGMKTTSVQISVGDDELTKRRNRKQP